MTASGRKLPVRINLFQCFERPLSGKADVQSGISENGSPNDRYTPVSGHSGGRVVKGRKRPEADIPGRLKKPN